MTATPLTIGAAARHFTELHPQTKPVKPWMVRRLFERGILPEPPRLGCYRVIHAGDLPEVEAALRKCGYLPAAEVADAR
jgi:hypothetical protein